MQYLISFLEGMITFISPCLLPMLPIYISYFAGDGEKNKRRVVKNALAFILGFTIVFIMMGALDSLVKGAAGQAVQNMNLLFGLKESEGLEMVPCFP